MMDGLCRQKALLVGVGLISAEAAAQYFLDMRSAVLGDDGVVQVETVFVQPIFDQMLYQSTTRTLPPPVGTVLIENEVHASLITGVIRLRNNCALSAQSCSGRTSWRDTLTFDATGIPAGETVLLDISATVNGTFGPSIGMGYTLFAQSASPFVVVDTLRATARYWNPTLTSTANADAFTDLDQQGTWSVYGPDQFAGQLALEAGVVNTVHVETIFNGDTRQDMWATFDIGNSSGLSYESASGVFLSASADGDGDSVVDAVDNCTAVANPLQRDSDDDGLGNVCDADLNNDCFVNLADLILFKAAFSSSDPHADFDGDGFVNLSDLIRFKALFGVPPGPSGRADICD